MINMIICVIQIKKKRINFLFIAVIYFPLSNQTNILTLNNNCYVILTSNMLDSALEPHLICRKIFYYCHAWPWIGTEIDGRYGT